MKYTKLEEAILSANSLDKADREQVRDEDNKQITQLHNKVYEEFSEEQSYEMTITFDDKKLKRIFKTDVHDEVFVEIAVKTILQEQRVLSNFKWFVIREWSEAGLGRLHYHGILTQVKGGQTQMAHLQGVLKRYFGRNCRIHNIYDIDGYICYMLKRTYKEEDLLYNEWMSTELIHTYFNDDINAPHYTWNDIVEWHEQHKEEIVHAI